MAEMSPQELMQHELGVRAQVIADLQAENARSRQMLEGLVRSCDRLRDEVLHVTLQTHAVVKAMMLLEGEQVARIPGHMLLKAREYVLQKGETTQDDDKGTLVFLLRELTDEEREQEQVLRAAYLKSSARSQTPRLSSRSWRTTG